MLTPGFHYDVLKPYTALMADSAKVMLVSGNDFAAAAAAVVTPLTLRKICIRLPERLTDVKVLLVRLGRDAGRLGPAHLKTLGWGKLVKIM